MFFFYSPKQQQQCEIVVHCDGLVTITNWINHSYDNISRQIADPKITLWLLTLIDFKIEEI